MERMLSNGLLVRINRDNLILWCENWPALVDAALRSNLPEVETRQYGINTYGDVGFYVKP